MNIYNEMSYIGASFFLILLITLIISVLFSVIDSNGSVSAVSTGYTAYKAGGAFHLATESGELGRLDTSKISDCSSDAPGFQSNARPFALKIINVSVGSDTIYCESDEGQDNFVSIMKFSYYSEPENSFNTGVVIGNE